MCRAVTGKTCRRPTWAGCGAHVEQVDGEKNLYNSRQPADDVANYLEPWSKILESGGYSPDEAKAAAMQVLPTSSGSTAPGPPAIPMAES